MNQRFKKIIEILDKYDVKAYVGGEQVETETYTPAGEDWIESFDFDENDVNVFVNSLKERVENFDIDNEAQPYIEMRGKRGVPLSIQVLLDDARWKHEKLKEWLKELGEV